MVDRQELLELSLAELDLIRILWSDGRLSAQDNVCPPAGLGSSVIRASISRARRLISAITTPESA